MQAAGRDPSWEGPRPQYFAAWPDALDQERTIGTNKRYAEHIDARMTEKVNAQIMAERTPDGLADSELELDRYPLTRTPTPIKARAWVHYDSIPIRVQVEVVAWTPKACAIRWTTPQGREEKIWVWASAVDDTPPPLLRQRN